MKKLRAWFLRAGGIFSKSQRDHEFAAEIESHLQMQIEDNLRSGMTAGRSATRGLVKLGGVEQTRQAYRERGTVPFFESVGQDLRFALRQLVKNPGFAFTAIFVLALGMGASVAIFAFVDAALLKPLPYRDPARLVYVTESVPMIPLANLSYMDYQDWKKLNRTLGSLDVLTGSAYSINTPSGLQLAPGARVSAGFFRTLGVAPLLGRDFLAGEDSLSAAHAVILSYTGWQKWFSGRQDVIGQSINLSGVVLHRRRRAAAGLSLCAARARRLLGSTASSRRLRKEAELPQPHRRRAVKRWRLGCDREGRSRVHSEAVGSAVSRQQQRPGGAVLPLSESMLSDVRPILLLLLGGALLLADHCLRQRSQPAAGALGKPQARNRGTRCIWARVRRGSSASS